MFAYLLVALQSAPSAAATLAAPAPLDRMVCRTVETATGSIMPGRRTCRRKSEWAVIDAQNRRAMDRIEIERQRGTQPTN
ncbi:hypothetical protein [Sphingomonas sp.]|uniref:hypothetical protein n=1 Tax=Sphingomonas sp. TaxID=28214 RepID=UPI003CC692A2